MLYCKLYNIMSVREIIGSDGKIESRYLPTTGTVPQLNSKQILTGNSSGDYVVLGGSQPAGQVLAATASGLQWQAAIPTIQLNRGELITSDGTQTVALPYPGSPADGFRLEVDPDVSNPTGLRWASVTDAVEEEAPMSGEPVTGNPGKLSIAINYAAGATGQGQIPVGINFPTGRRGTLLNRGPVGTCLTVANGSGTAGTGLEWANPPVSSVTATATSNITVTSPSTNNYSVALANPLNNNVSLADKNISGTTGNITFLDTANATTSVLSATNLSVTSTSAGTTSAFLNDLGVTMNSGSSATTLSANGISKTGNNSALVLNHAFSAGNINLQTNSGVVTTNCPLQPNSIKDSATSPSTGSGGQILSAGAGGSLLWVTPTVPAAATLTSVLNAGNINTSNKNMDMGSKLIQNVSSPSATSDAATKGYVDTAVSGVSRTLTQVLTAGNSAGSSTINMNSNKITSLTTPTDANDAANKTYVDGAITTALTPYTVKSLTGGTNVTVSNASGNWTINAAGAGGPLSNVAQPTNKTVSYNTSTNVLATTTGTSVSIFSNIGARDVALTSPFVGQFCFITENNFLQFWNNGWFNVSPLVVPVITGFTLGSSYNVSYVDATGTVVVDPVVNGSTIMRFYTAGSTTINGTIMLSKTALINYLIVGGGGGGGGSIINTTSGGGGGAGGYESSIDSMYASTPYAIQVGGGGTAGLVGSAGTNGTNSILAVQTGTLTAIGGGGGSNSANGATGGSGGGGGASGSNLGLGGTATSPPQGNKGGDGSPPFPPFFQITGGGGGGAGAAGASGNNATGGVGLSNSITGIATFYAGGGGGGTSSGSSNTGGNGGGGNSGFTGSANGVSGTDSLGGGGGGAGYNVSSSADGGAGGSGVVIVKFPSFIF
jgi:hypothetical protein